MSGVELPPEPSGHHPLVEALDNWQAQTMLADPDGRREFFGDLSFDGYQRWLVAVNKYAQRGEQAGYLFDEQFNVQLDDVEGQGPDDGATLENRILLFSPSHKVGMFALREALGAAQQMDDQDAGLVMLGIVQLGVHRLRNGHTRTSAAGRQLLSPIGRGYHATEADRNFYDRLVTDNSLYLEQSLHPWKADLPGIYSFVMANIKAARMGYEGPPISMGTREVRHIFDMLPDLSLWWGDDNHRLIVSQILSEADFSLLTAVECLDAYGESLDNYVTVDGKTQTARLDPSKLANFLNSLARWESLRLVWDAHDAHKKQFFLSVIECIAHGDETVFGPPSQVLDRYRLQQ